MRDTAKFNKTNINNSSNTNTLNNIKEKDHHKK
jgi:hypothetical protein